MCFASALVPAAAPGDACASGEAAALPEPLPGHRYVQRLIDFLCHRYHLPSDDLAQPVGWTAAARFAHLNCRIGLAIGDAVERPAWKPGDFPGGRSGR